MRLCRCALLSADPSPSPSMVFIRVHPARPTTLLGLSVDVIFLGRKKRLEPFVLMDPYEGVEELLEF